MSANFYELLKYAATGIASPDMTYYDKMRASTLMGGAVQTLTGQPPLSFKSNGKPLISWSMKGNGVQSGTPSPDSIIMPTFCGVRTGNLVDESKVTLNTYISHIGVTGSSTVTNLTDYIDISGSPFVISGVRTTDVLNTSTRGLCFYDSNKKYISGVLYSPDVMSSPAIYLNIPENAKYVRFAFDKAFENGIMLSSGSTALPYEPFGVKIPILCGGETTPVYLGEVPTVRRVKKLVLTGQESGTWSYNTVIRNGNGFYNLTVFSGYKPNSGFGYCTHYPLATAITDTIGVFFGGNINFITDFSEGIDTADKWKSYLATQYANGTPVTVWYVLATEQTGISNEPLAKIGDYADELHSEDDGVTIPTAKGANTLTVDTELQPSEMTITFKG